MTPFSRADIPQSEIDLVTASVREDYLKDPAAYRKLWSIPEEVTLIEILVGIAKDARKGEIWLNDQYQVNVHRVEQLPGAGWPPLVHLSIKRIDREPIHDWRDLQRIKTEIIGPECEAVELYPAESRVVDTANQYHLWCFTTPGARWPFGFENGIRSNARLAKSKQRPL